MAHTVATARQMRRPAEVRKYEVTLVWTKLATQTSTPVSTGYSKR